jgi:hypothetical protein
VTSLCVFCGSRHGKNPASTAAAQLLGHEIVRGGRRPGRRGWTNGKPRSIVAECSFDRTPATPPVEALFQVVRGATMRINIREYRIDW